MSDITAPSIEFGPRLCKNCKWARLGLFERLFMGWNYAKCGCQEAQPEWVRDDHHAETLVSGWRGKLGTYCTIARRDSSDGRCGEQGTFWEPKG